MKPCLADVNVLLALLVRQHEHPELVLRDDSVRGVPAGTAWRLIEELDQDERIAFIPEPEHLDSVLPTLLNSPVPTGKLSGDAYLAAFSIAGSQRTVTFDRGFRHASCREEPRRPTGIGVAWNYTVMISMACFRLARASRPGAGLYSWAM
jgi:predicted nucleic acid-binding protein